MFLIESGRKMGLLNKLFGNKSTKIINNIHTFNDWMDDILENADFTNIIAVNFNLYEGTDKTYHVELIGSDQYTPGDNEWACNEVFTTRDHLFIIVGLDVKSWEEALAHFKADVLAYLKKGRYNSKLLSMRAVGIGFVDGDLEILHEEAWPAFFREVVEDIKLNISEEANDKAITFATEVLRIYPQKLNDIAVYLSQDDVMKTFFGQTSTEEIIAGLNKPILTIIDSGGVLSYCNHTFDSIHIIDLEFGGVLEKFYYVSIDG